MIIGSCFANEIGSILKSYSFNISVNPFGTLYNPISIISSLDRIAQRSFLTTRDVINISLHSTQNPNSTNMETDGIANDGDGANNKFCSFFHHSSFAKESATEFLEHANNCIRKEAEFFKECDTIIMTLGTSWIFHHTERNMVVSNCHKINPREFTRKFLPLGECVENISNFITKYPDKKFIFTVSPIRHLKDGAHGNQISKATLLMAIDEILRLHPDNTYYFPAYEILLDELRDYRFYAEDMVHPSDLAVKYIFDKFKEHCIQESAYPEMARMIKLHKQQSHRSIN